MNGTNDKDAIRQWLEEQFGVVVEGTGPGTGAVTLCGLLHHAHSGEVELHTMSARHGGPHWGKPEQMAEAFDSIATRHARGISGGGAQQFQLALCRGDSGKPTAFLPFVRVGAPNITANGSLATEPPTAVGAQSQAMRLLEVLATGSFAQVGHLVTTQAGLVDKLAARLDVVEKRSDERWLALQNLLVTWQQQSLNSQFRALGIEAARKLLPLIPAAVSTLTGSDTLVPPAAVQESVFDALVETYSGEQLQELIGAMPRGDAGGALTALVADALVKAKRRKAERDRVLSGAQSTYEAGERDAAGEVAARALRSEPSKELVQRTDVAKGSGNEHSANGALAAPPETRESGAEVLRDLFAAFGPQAESMLGLVEDKHPELAARIRRSIAPKEPA